MQKEIIKYRDEKVEMKDLDEKHVEIIIKMRKSLLDTIYHFLEDGQKIDNWIFSAILEYICPKV